MSNLSDNASIAAASLVAIVAVLDALGLDSKRLLSGSGILPDQMGRGGRIPQEQLSALICRLSEIENSHLIGLKFAEHVHATTYDAFGVLLVSSKNIRSFCSNSARYYAFVNTGVELRFNVSEAQASLVYGIPERCYKQPVERFLNASGWAASWLKLMRMASRPDYSPCKVTFTFAEPASSSEIKDYFGCPVEFDSAVDALFFNVDEEFDAILPGGNAELARHSETLLFQEVRALGVTDIENAVRVSLFELLSRGETSLDIVAEKLGLDAMEVQSGLRAVGKNLTQVIRETRQELAEDYVTRADLTINEVAYMLGFSDCSNFARSFRRWTGLSPSEYRSQFLPE